MAVVGYTPHEAGGYVFHRDDGPSMHFSGAEADGLRQWLDASRGSDARLAYDPAAPFGSTQSVPDQPPAPPRTVVDVGAQGGMSTAPPAAPAMSVAPAAVPPGPPQAPAAGAAVPTPQPVMVGEEGPTISGPEAAAYALRKRYVGGRAAYDPEADAAMRRPVPISRTVTGGLALSPEEEKQRLEDAKAVHAANQTAISEVEAASAERVAAAEDARRNALNSAIEADQQRREALAKQEAVQNTWDTTNARLQKERDATTEMRVDPHRLFSGAGGAIAAIGSALAVGLGAFGATMAHTPNYAQQIVDASIQRDIDSQVDQIHRKGAAAQNAIADFQRSYGLTLDEARTAVKATQLRYAASMADMNAARIGSADARQQGAVLKADLMQRAMLEEAKLQENYKGRISTQFAMAAPQRASAGYLRDPTDKEIKEGAEAIGAVNKAAGGAKTPEEKNSELQAQKFVTEYGEKRRELLVADRDMRELAAKMGSTVNPDQTLTQPEKDIPGTGATSMLPNVMLTQEGRDVQRQRSRVISSVLKALTGMGVTEREAKQVQNQIEGTWDEDAVKGLQQAMQVVRDYHKKLDASYGPSVVQQYQQQENATDRMSAAKERGGAKLEKY